MIIISFLNYRNVGTSSSDIHDPGKNGKMSPKKVSKKIGEYIDYEEIKK